MGKPALRLILSLDGDRNNKSSKDDCFAYTKVPTNQIANIHGIESLNFNLIDTNLTYEIPINQMPQEFNVPDGYSIRFARPDDRKEIGDISENNFRFSRFHLDPSVGTKTANQIKRAWAENYFNAKRGDFMVVAVADQHPVGFTQVLHSGDMLTIDLIAVQSSYHGQGLGGAMISFLSSRIQDKVESLKRIRVGTQISNLPSISLYEKMGFRIFSSEYVFHHHGKLKLKS